MIDFLIFFGAKKKAEHLIRSVQGKGDIVSCVDPAAYAARQVRFMRTSIVEEREEEDDAGTVGSLLIDVTSATNLINADGLFDLSDPYVVIELGLQSVRT